ncbi:hypothetical protein T11_17664 [Trichinella zimbabwensis]|uniref:Uncharacterized protein n=1 Tax=Trichinella zimbabwensis TaxID=268475 RepID=A0A0V1DT80_9BILA|nr:hypothetical protein T11_17664 [Trichinella zimbabwensis]
MDIGDVFLCSTPVQRWGCLQEPDICWGFLP